MSNDKIIIPSSTLEIKTGKYLIIWKDALWTIKAEISRVKDDSHCEIMVTHSNGTGEQFLLPPTSTNLISNRELNSLSDTLKDKTPQIDKATWRTMLGDAAYKAITAMRQGDPVIMLNDSLFGKVRPEFLLPPLFIKNAPNIIYGDRGAAKTTFIIMVALALSKPWFDNRIGLLIPKVAKHKILYLDWENNEEIIGWQKACLCRGMGINNLEIAYRHCSRPLADDLPQVQAAIDQTGADIAILDSLGMAVGDDLNLTKPAFTFFGAIRQLPVTCFILAHTSKDKENKRKTVYGNYYYELEARSIWEAEKQQEVDSNELIFNLYHRKPAPFQGLHSPIAYKFTFEDDTTFIESSEPKTDKRESSDNPSNTEVVLMLLAEAGKSGLSPIEISGKTDPTISPNAVRKACWDLKNKQKRIYDSPKKDGRYVTAEYYEPPLQM